ncbi:MAG: PAS domain S-box protein [Candidatus Methylumidiphilus sp.]
MNNPLPPPSMSPANTVPRAVMMSLIGITAATGLMGVAIILWLHLAERFGLELPFWMETVLITSAISVTASLLFWFASAKTLFTQLSKERGRNSHEQRMNADLKRALDEHALVSIADVSGKIIFANEKFCKVSGYTQEELLGKDHRIVNSGHHERQHFQGMWQTIACGGVWQGEFRNSRKDGSDYWVDTTIIPFLDEQGKPYQYVAVRREITDLKNIQTRTEKLGERLKWLLDASPSVIYANEDCDDLTHCTFISGNSLDIVGYTSTEMLSARDFWFRHLHPSDQKLAKELMPRLLEKGKVRLEYRFLSSNGKYLWISDNARVVRNGEGTIQAIAGSWTDITESKAAEYDRLRLRMAAEASADMIFLADANGLIEYANPAFCRFTGWNTEELSGKTPGILESGRTSPAIYQAIRETLSRGESWRGRLLNRRKENNEGSNEGNSPVWQDSLPHRRKEDPVALPTDQKPDPLLCWADVSITPIRDEAGANIGYVSIQRDISAEVAREERLALFRLDTEARFAVVEILNQSVSLEERFSKVLDKLLELPYLVHKGGVFLRDPNGECLELFVRKGEFSEGFPCSEQQQILLGDCLCGQAAVSSEVSVSDDCFCGPRHEHRFAGMANHGHYIVPLATGEDTLGVMFLYTDPQPLQSPERIGILKQIGEAMGIAIIRDHTRKMIEQARDAALDASRQKSVFLANMSHEIRTPMNGILGMIEILQRTRLDAEQMEFANTAASSAEALLAIINSILDFSKIEAGKLELDSVVFDLRILVEEVCALLAAQAFAKGLELNCFVEPKLPEALRGDPMRLRQILTNLVGNAIKFTHHGEVSVEVVCLAENEKKNTLRIKVADTGIGISPKDQQRLFNPFEQADGATTRRFGGTGLGLSICKRLIEHMGGSEIHIESVPGVGSSFWFDISLEKREDHGVTTLPATLAKRKILIVDDNATNRTILERLLRDWGAVAYAANSAPQALEMLRNLHSKEEPFDMVIMDMNMPDMDGLMLAQAMTEEKGLADIPRILLSSGGLVTESERVKSGIRHTLTKPVRQSLLFDAVLSSLDSGWSQARIKGIPPPGALPSFAGRKVLLVEDNVVNQKVALKMLACFGVDAHLAGNGREALNELERNPYDLVLMDCHMPEMDGYAATRAFRERERHSLLKRTPVVALTANALVEDRERCVDAGMDDHMSKPLMLEALSKMLQRWLTA